MEGGHDAGYGPLQAKHFRALSDIAANLADAVVKPGSLQRDATVRELMEIALEIADADVVSCCLVGIGQTLELLFDEKWRDPTLAVGKVPRLRPKEFCCKCFNRVTGGPRTAESNIAARDFGEFHEEHLEHFEWLGSEAFIPLQINGDNCKAVITLGHNDSDHFSQERLAQLEEFHELFNSFYSLADYLDDRLEKSKLVRDTAQALPTIAAAPSRLAFSRAVCVLLTCEYGFGFDRAMLFWLTDGELPATCEMAVGGVDEDWPKRVWANLKDSTGFNNLTEYIRDALDNPILGDDEQEQDPFYTAAASPEKPLIVPDNETGRQFLNGVKQLRQRSGIGVPKISEKEQAAIENPQLRDVQPWMRDVHQASPGIFASLSDEYFVFELRPFANGDDTPPLGFVIADLAWRPIPHTPGLGNPDLVMTQFSLNLLAGLWRFRDDVKSYFHVLAALPILQHAGPKLLTVARLIRFLIDDLEKVDPQVRPQNDLDIAETLQLLTPDLDHALVQMTRAQGILKSVRKNSESEHVQDLPAELLRIAKRSEQRHFGKLKVEVGDLQALNSIGGRIPTDSFSTMVDCILDNAVRHGSKDDEIATLRINCCLVDLDGRKSAKLKRIKISFLNESDEISDYAIPYLFVEGVTSDSQNGQGTGLASARRIAQAHGGDVVLISPRPVEFAIILEPVFLDSSDLGWPSTESENYCEPKH